jgi:hypothetical protein
VGAQVAELGEPAQVQVQELAQVQVLSPAGRVACAEWSVGWREPLEAVLDLLRQAVLDPLQGVLDPPKQAVPDLLQAAVPEPRRPSRTAPQ